MAVCKLLTFKKAISLSIIGTLSSLIMAYAPCLIAVSMSLSFAFKQIYAKPRLTCFSSKTNSLTLVIVGAFRASAFIRRVKFSIVI